MQVDCNCDSGVKLTDRFGVALRDLAGVDSRRLLLFFCLFVCRM